jgi:hypothetical protein
MRGLVGTIAVVLMLQGVGATAQTAGAAKTPYPQMAPIERYLIADEAAEVRLARSAAPSSISDSAEVMVLGRDGYKTAVKGTNGFLCIVERSWGKPTDDAEFWNPEMRAPHCFNAAAVQTFVPIYLMKTKLVMAGKSREEIGKAIPAAFSSGALPKLGPGAMCYMMSKEQYLDDEDKSWHPHLMFFAPNDAAKSWGANLPGSPLIAADDPQERVTVFMMVVGKWSDGTAGPQMAE